MSSASTTTFPLPKIPSHNSVHECTEWQNIRFPMYPGAGGGASRRKPFSGRLMCAPTIMDPGSDDKSRAKVRAMASCSTSENRWKNLEVWMTDIFPRRGARVVRELMLGVTASKVVWDPTKLSCKILPCTNFTENVSGVDRKSLCPMSQNSSGALGKSTKGCVRSDLAEGPRR